APLPAVPRALDLLAHDLATDTEVGAEVLAEGVHDGQPAGVGAEGDELLAEVLQRLDLARLDRVGPRHLEPPAGIPRRGDGQRGDVGADLVHGTSFRYFCILYSIAI